jgi:hypothetical protein
MNKLECQAVVTPFSLGEKGEKRWIQTSFFPHLYSRYQSMN